MIPTRFTHSQLASLVGSNREALTRALGRLRKAGAVEIKDRHIYVTDVDALNRAAEIGGKPAEVAQPAYLSNKCHPTARREVLRTAIKRWRLFKEIEMGHRFQTRHSNHRRRHRQ